MIVTNRLDSPALTGVLTDNPPYLALILLGGGCFVFFVVAKRRKRHNDYAE